MGATFCQAAPRINRPLTLGGLASFSMILRRSPKNRTPIAAAVHRDSCAISVLV